MDEGVELVCDPGVEVVGDAFGLRAVHDADRPLEPPALQQRRIDQKLRNAEVVQHFLPSAGQRAAHPFALGWAAPIGRRGDGPRVGRKANEQSAVVRAIADKLADVQLAGLA